MCSIEALINTDRFVPGIEDVEDIMSRQIDKNGYKITIGDIVEEDTHHPGEFYRVVDIDAHGNLWGERVNGPGDGMVASACDLRLVSHGDTDTAPASVARAFDGEPIIEGDLVRVVGTHGEPMRVIEADRQGVLCDDPDNIIDDGVWYEPGELIHCDNEVVFELYWNGDKPLPDVVEIHIDVDDETTGAARYVREVETGVIVADKWEDAMEMLERAHLLENLAMCGDDDE